LVVEVSGQVGIDVDLAARTAGEDGEIAENSDPTIAVDDVRTSGLGHPPPIAHGAASDGFAYTRPHLAISTRLLISPLHGSIEAG
jgi:hypothetical protein